MNFYSQDQRSLQITSNAFPESLFLLTDIEGEENLSESYAYTLKLISQEPNLDVARFFASSVKITLQAETRTPTVLQAYIQDFSQVESDVRAWSAYEMRVGSPLYFLKFASNACRFEQKTVIDILKNLCQQANVSLDSSEITKYSAFPALDYVIQYNENHFDFFHRLLHDAGLHYYFNHADKNLTLVLKPYLGEASEPKVILYEPTDSGQPFSRDAWFKNLGYAYSCVQEDDPVNAAHGYQWQESFNIAPSAFSSGNYNEEAPTDNLNSSVKAKTGVTDPLEIYDYPGEYLTKEKAKSELDIKLAQRLIHQQAETCKTYDARLKPGRWIQFKNHPQKDANQRYLITHISFKAYDYSQLAHPRFCHTSEGWYSEGRSVSKIRNWIPVPASAGRDPTTSTEITETATAQHYSNNIQLLPHTVRPANTGKPAIYPHGTQSAVTDGEAEQKLNLDTLGRTKITFFWQHGKDLEPSLHVLRTLQSVAGHRWGSQWFPRQADEVMLMFCYGKANRPIIVGSLYNEQNKPFYALPDHKNKNAWVTHSVGDANIQHELTFDDTTQTEVFTLSSGKDYQLRTEKEWQSTIHQDYNHSTQQKLKTQLDMLTLDAEQGITLNTGGQITLTPGKIHIAAKQVLLGDVGVGRVEKNEEPQFHIKSIQKDKNTLETLLSHLLHID